MMVISRRMSCQVLPSRVIDIFGVVLNSFT
jgi:hypothetical protein